MARALSPLQSAIISMAWAVGFVLLVLILSRTVGMRLDNQPILYALFLLGPILFAALSRQLSAVALGVLGVYAGILLAAALLAILPRSTGVYWSQTFLQGAIISIADLVVSVPVWWCVRRLRHEVAA